MNGDLRYRSSYERFSMTTMTNANINFNEILVAERNGTLTTDMLTKAMLVKGLSEKQRDYITRLWMELTTGEKEKKSKDFVDFCVQGGGCAGK